MVSTVRVNLGERSYDVVLASDRLAEVGAFARRLVRGPLALIVTDDNVRSLARSVAESFELAGFRPVVVPLPPGEGTKALPYASQLWDALAEAQADRRTPVVAVGGGVVGDLAGFAAATFARGVPLLMVPTTLLAMVDSSVGGKVAINHPLGKNLIGAFHQPAGVFIDTATLATLPDRELRSGLAEVVKYGAALDAELFDYLETNRAACLGRDPEVMRHIVARSCEIKARIVEQDEREEKGLRAVLNYGHTFAHAFETAAGYGGWLHGEAVAAGMACAARLAQRRGLIGPELVERQGALLRAFALPVRPESWPVEQLVKTMRGDKKAVAGQMRFVLPTRLGAARLFDDVPETDVRAVLSEMAS